jgi:hypothetical protein
MKEDDTLVEEKPLPAKPATKKTTKRRGRPPKAKTPDFPKDDLGMVDWKELVPKKYMDLSEEWCSANGITKSEMTREEIEEKLDEVGDEAKVILLAGFKTVAKIRGLQSIKSCIVRSDSDSAVAECKLTFTDMDGELKVATGNANASKENTSFPFSMYLESMAENRAFIRAVRYGLNINIIGYEELTGKESGRGETTGFDEEGGSLSPQETLKQIVEAKNKTLGELRAHLQKKDYKNLKEEYKDFADIPAEVCFEIVGMIQ